MVVTARKCDRRSRARGQAQARPCLCQGHSALFANALLRLAAIRRRIESGRGGRAGGPARFRALPFPRRVGFATGSAALQPDVGARANLPVATPPLARRAVPARPNSGRVRVGGLPRASAGASHGGAVRAARPQPIRNDCRVAGCRYRRRDARPAQGRLRALHRCPAAKRRRGGAAVAGTGGRHRGGSRRIRQQRRAGPESLRCVRRRCR